MKTNTPNVRFLLILLILLAASLAGAQDQSVFEPRPLARIVYLEGTVRVDAVPAVTGQMVPYGALVQTDSDSYAEITMGAKNVIRVQESTVLVLDVSTTSLRVDLRAGGVAAVLHGLDRISPDMERSRPRFYLESRGTVAGVRGTSFYAQVESPTSTYICTCNGSLEFAGEGYSDFSTEYYHHGARRFITGPTGRVSVEVAPLLYHDDEDMDELAHRVGELIPWSDSY